MLAASATPLAVTTSTPTFPATTKAIMNAKHKDNDKNEGNGSDNDGNDDNNDDDGGGDDMTVVITTITATETRRLLPASQPRESQLGH